MMRLMPGVFMLSLLLSLLTGCAGAQGLARESATPTLTATPTFVPPTATPTLTATATFAPPTATPTFPAVITGFATCPITRPPNPPFVPPAPWPPEREGGRFWFGTPELWTELTGSGTWGWLPHSPTGYTQKIVFWKSDYNAQLEQQPKLTLTGERLDAAAPLYITSDGTSACHPDFGGCAMMMGIELPSLGCWKLTVEHKGYELSFVVWVVS